MIHSLYLQMTNSKIIRLVQDMATDTGFDENEFKYNLRPVFEMCNRC